MTAFDWRLRGNCSVRAAESFFPISYGNAATQPARALCDGCPVATTCLQWAVEVGEPEGIYGGRTAAERKKYGTGPMPERKTAEPKPETKAAKRRGPRSYTCSQGHRKTEDGSGRWVCKRCSHDRLVAWRAAQSEQVPA